MSVIFERFATVSRRSDLSGTQPEGGEGNWLFGPKPYTAGLNSSQRLRRNPRGVISDIFMMESTKLAGKGRNRHRDLGTEHEALSQVNLREIAFRSL